ncbi:MAG TPA: DUF4055 domain-containing protein [Allocoleopsis sp.]
MTGLPNSQCAAYRQQASLWRYLDDVFSGSEAWLGRDEQGKIHVTPKAKVYLPQEPAEPGDAYLSRLARSPFDDRFAQSVRKFVNLIFANGVRIEGAPSQLYSQNEQGLVSGHWLSLDNQGTHGDLFLIELAIAVMRRGHTFLLVDFPPADGVIRTHADFLASGRRPYWVHYHATDVIHWRTTKVGGRTVLAQVTLQERSLIPDGDFGEREETFYRVLRPGRFDVYTIAGEGSQQRSTHHPDKSGVSGFVQPNGAIQPLRFIPLIPFYGGLREGFFCSRPPLKSLADLNVTHYQVKSDHLQKIHKCCMPIPVIRDAFSNGEDVSLGPNTLLHIRDPQGGFSWEEPSAGSIEQSRKEVLDLEAAMDVLSAAYLSDPGDRQAATTTLMQSVELESSLQAFATQFAEGINQALAIHAFYLGQQSGGRVTLSGEVVREKGRDSQMLLAYSAMGDRRQLSRRSLLQLLKDQQFLPESFDVNQEAPDLNDDAELLNQILQLGLRDVLSKRDVLQLLVAHRFVLSDFEIGKSIRETGDKIRTESVGAIAIQPQ